MSEFYTFHADRDETNYNCFDLTGSFDFEKEFILENQEYTPIEIPNRMGLSSPNSSDESAHVEQTLSTDNSNPVSFPVLLHDIISNDEYQCIHWLPCGEFFAISDKEGFTKQVIPRFFDARGTTKFTSFTRRLKRWHFKRVPSGTNHGAYYHDNFRRGELELAATIIYPGKGSKKGSSAPIVKSKIKACRRASTGCMVDPEAVSDFGFTPIPIKPSVQITSNPGMLELDSDMTELLASPDFVSDQEPFAKLEGAPPTTPVFSSSKLQPAPVTDFSLKDPLEETSGCCQTQPIHVQSRTKHSLSLASEPILERNLDFDQSQLTSAQSEKLQLSSPSCQPITKTNLLMRNQSLLQNNPLNIMQPVDFPGILNANQLLMRKQTSQPQMRRHSCMPMLGASNVDAASMFGASSGGTGIFIQPFPAYTSVFNPMLHARNNMYINHNITAGEKKILNTKIFKFREQKAGKLAMPSSHEVMSKNRHEGSMSIDFDEYVARQED